MTFEVDCDSQTNSGNCKRVTKAPVVLMIPSNLLK